jgi:hypothetical protein
MRKKSHKRHVLIILTAALIALSILYLKKVGIITFPKPKVPLDVVHYFPFSDEASLGMWKEKVLKGHVIYSIEKAEDQSYVGALSDKTASAMYYKTKMSIEKQPIISWKWSVNEFPEKKGKEDLSIKKQDDFAARVYVIFPAFFFTGTRSIEYVWANEVEEGTVTASPYTKNLVLFVIQSGGETGQWVSERRNIYEDYKRAFGEEPGRDVGAVAFMTDADSTKTKARAKYDEITLGYKKSKEKK